MAAAPATEGRRKITVRPPRVKLHHELSRSCSHPIPCEQIAIEGCCHGELDNIYGTLQHLEKAEGKKIDLLISCGDFQACGWMELRGLVGCARMRCAGLPAAPCTAWIAGCVMLPCVCHEGPLLLQ